MICPECGTRLPKGKTECHFCSYTQTKREISLSNSNIPDNSLDNPSWTLFDFVKYNAPLFTVIGITGTMISLIPTFLNYIIGPDWKLFLIKDLIGLLLVFIIQIVISSGALLILVIASLILNNLLSCNLNPEKIHQIFSRDITKGTLQKLLFALVFIPTIFAFIYFIMPIFLYQSDPYFKLINIVVITGYLAAVLYLLFVFGILTSSSHSKIILLIVLTVTFVFVIGGSIFFITFPLIPQFSPTVNLTNNNTEIITNHSNYSIFNSTELGIPLQAGGNITMSDIDKRYYLTTVWSTNFGYFISSDPKTHITKIQGSDCEIDNGYSTLYWTYDARDQGIKKPPVFIFLTVKNIRKDEIVGISQANITWIDLDTARVA
jgi:hypothetical protein